MALKEFQAESKRLMDLMINSIYTHKEIFLRELISNASDAIDKFYYQSAGGAGLNRDDFFIRIEADKDSRTLTITDNGVGMSKEELDQNLGVIAKSGSLKFKRETLNGEKQEDVDIIGQFGVGFYSAFMVSSKVVVESLAAGSSQAFAWSSEGLDGYEISECGYPNRGTKITLTIKEDTEEENYSEFLDQFRLSGLVKRYSDYIRYPIKMQMQHSHLKEGTGVDGKDPEYETHYEDETLNSMTPIWKKAKSETTDEELNAFYKEKFYDWQDPQRVIRTSTEGAATYTALLFVPKKAPYDYYTREYEKGLQLYASGVLIMDKCPDLLPDCFSFVKGLVDSQDLSLNISREMLQHDRQLKLIAGRLEKKIAAELKSMLQNDREKYEEFFGGFGLQLKYGVYENYGAKKDELKDLILFRSSKDNALVTLKEYVDRMPADQPAIYYGCGDTAQHILALPQAEALKDKGYELLLLTDNVDEFAIKMLEKYEEKEFKNISAEGLDLGSEEEKARVKDLAGENEALLSAMKEALGDKVKEVRLSLGLRSYPACVTTEGAISTEMEKVLNAMPTGEKVRAQRVLELNPDHAMFQRLCGIKDDPEKLKLYSQVLYGQAMLIEGVALEDPAEFARQVCEIIL